MKLENYRTNRQTCPPAQRPGFDQLIANAQAELNHAAKGDAILPDQLGQRSIYA
jgi:hypothetical protein